MAGGTGWQFVAFFFLFPARDEVQLLTLFPVVLPALCAGCLVSVVLCCIGGDLSG